MIRITILTFLIAYLSVYAWKDWFRGACWLVLLMAVFQHPDMPKSVGGIPGLNHWNFLFLNVVCSWWVNRKVEKLTWDMPKHFNFLLFIYSIVIFLSVIRYLSDMSGVIELVQSRNSEVDSTVTIINEYLINCFKWVLPGIIIFDGCRTKKQYDFALFSMCIMFALLALQVVKAMKLGSLAMGGEALQLKAIKIITNSVGFHRVNVSMMMSGAFWAVFCLKELLADKYYWLLILPTCFIIFLAMALTGGRAGYATWAILGAVFCLFKWRKYLLLAPIILFFITIIAPSAIERLTQGIFPEEEYVTEYIDFEKEELNLRTITSGRVIAWPLVWESIKDAPFIGYGREAMKNTGITLQIIRMHGPGELFPHPHNAYLQWIQDNGLLGSIPVFIFYFLLVKYSWSLFRDETNSLYVVTGGVALSLLLSFIIASTGSQTFYPREGAVGMWVGIGLMLRVYIERIKVRSGKNSELCNS